jgi:hypothetical protein
MIAMILVVLVSAGNFALGFALAVYFGHGPVELPFVGKLPVPAAPHHSPAHPTRP